MAKIGIKLFGDEIGYFSLDPLTLGLSGPDLLGNCCGFNRAENELVLCKHISLLPPDAVHPKDALPRA